MAEDRTSSRGKAILYYAAITVVLGLLIFTFLSGRQELKKVEEMEKPVAVSSHLKQTQQGEIQIALNEHSRELAGIKTEPVKVFHHRPLIPRSSILYEDGKTWIFVEIARNVFARREVKLSEPAEAGFPITKGLSGHDTIVTVGAQALLSEELKSQIQIGGD